MITYATIRKLTPTPNYPFPIVVAFGRVEFYVDSDTKVKKLNYVTKEVIVVVTWDDHVIDPE